MFRPPALRLTSGHPRLWIKPDQLPAFRQAARSYRRAWRDGLLADLEPHLAAPATVRALATHSPDHVALALGQAWQLTGDRRYAVAARWLLEGLWTYPTGVRHDYDVWGVTAEAAALAYDWLHDYWTAEHELPAVADVVHFTARQALDHFLHLYILDDWHNYALGLQAGALAGALALGDDHPQLPARRLLQTLHQLHFTGYRFQHTRMQDLDRVAATRMCLQDHFIARGGAGFYGHQEATGGYHLVDSYEFIKMACLWSSALRGSAPVWPELDRIGIAHLSFLRPDLKNLVWGDSSAAATHRTRLGVMLMHLNVRRPPAAAPQPAFEAYVRALVRPQHLSRLVHGLMCAPPELAQAPAKVTALDRGALAALPASAWLDPLAVLRSGWRADDTLVSFRVGRHGGGHNHFDHNSFTIFRGGPLAVDSGWVDYADRSRIEYSIRTLAHNAILVRDPREKFWHGRHAAPTQNDGGQRLTTNSYNPPNPHTGTPHAVLTEDRRRRLHDEFDMGELLAHRFESDFDYVAGDATRAYTYPWSGQGTNPARRVEECVRQLVFLKPDLIVVFDRIEQSRADLQATWLLHTLNEPVGYSARGRPRRPGRGVHTLPNCRCLEAVAGRGRLTVWPLGLGEQTVRVIGGRGYETWIEHPAPPDPAAGKNFTPPRSQAESGRWRIELQALPNRSGPQPARVYFLTVLHAGLHSDPPARERYQLSVSATTATVTLSVIEKTGNAAAAECARLQFHKQGRVQVQVHLKGTSKKIAVPAPGKVPRA